MIEAWLDEELSEEQLQEFRDLEAKDAEWNLKVSEVKSLRQDLESYLLKSELDQIHSEAFPRPKTKSASIPHWFWAIAASVLLFVIAWASFQGVFQNHNERLFEAYYVTDPGLITAMSGSESYAFDRGMVDFKEGNFQGALGFWEPLLEESPKEDTLLYFVAMANMELEQYGTSQKTLEELLDGNPSEFEEDARWYLALIYLRNDDTEKAKSLLSQSQRSEAKAILEEIE